MKTWPQFIADIVILLIVACIIGVGVGYLTHTSSTVTVTCPKTP